MDTSRKQNKSDGRINLGFRRLVVSYVENAGTLYAYTEEDAGEMAVMDKIVEQCAKMPKITNAPQVDRMYGAFHSGRWFRAEVEQIIRKDEKNIRIRMVDYGWKDFVKISQLCQLPQNLIEAKIKCEKYKMAAMKPRGRYEGYSAADREKGKEWLEKTIDGRVVDAECHILVKYGGGIQMDCQIGDLNLNAAALESGHAILLKDRMEIINEMSGSVSSLKRSNSQSFRKEHKPQRNNRQKKSYGDMKKHQEGKHGVAGDSASKGDLNEIFLLLDKAVQARKDATDSSEIKPKNTIMKLINIPETVMVAVDALGPLIEGIEAVTAASKLLEEAKKKAKNDAHKVALLESTTILYKCINKFLSQYSIKQDEINNIGEKIEKQLSGLPSTTIPASWRLLTVKAEKIAKNNLLDINKNVKKFLDDWGANQIHLFAKSEAEVDKLANCLVQIAEGIQAKFKDGADCQIPADIDSLMNNVQSALRQEINEAKLRKNVKKNPELSESSAVGSAWRVLTALRGQLELLKKKKSEYENIHKDLEADISP